MGVGWINRRKTVKQVRHFDQGSPGEEIATTACPTSLERERDNPLKMPLVPWFFSWRNDFAQKSGGGFSLQLQIFILRTRRHHQPVRLDVHPTCSFLPFLANIDSLPVAGGFKIGLWMSFTMRSGWDCQAIDWMTDLKWLLVRTSRKSLDRGIWSAKATGPQIKKQVNWEVFDNCFKMTVLRKL